MLMDCTKLKQITNIIAKCYFIYLNNEKCFIFLIIYIKSRGIFSIFLYYSLLNREGN